MRPNTRRRARPIAIVLALLLAPLVVAAETADVQERLRQAEADIQAMQEAGFGVRQASLTYDFAINLSHDPAKTAIVNELVEEISSARRLAFETMSTLATIEEGMRQAEEDGLVLHETKDMHVLARSALQREDYATAYSRASQAALALVLETKGEFNVVSFLRKYFWYLLPLFAYLAYVLYLIYNKILYSRGDEIFRDLSKEEQTIRPLIQHIEEEYFKKKSISKPEYHKAMHQYRRRLAEIKRLKAEVKTKTVQYGGREAMLRRLRQEHDYLFRTIREMQERRFMRMELDREQYRTQVRELSDRLIDVEMIMALLERAEEEERMPPKKEGSFLGQLLKPRLHGGNGRW